VIIFYPYPKSALKMSSTSPSSQSELLELSASQAAPSLRSGRRSHADYTSALLTRFEEIKFDATLTPDFTPEKLKAQLALPSDGKLKGALAGVPFLVTPNIDVAGFKTHAGSKTLALASPDTDAPVVAALKAAGGIVMGQANMHELGQGVTCVNATYGAAKNVRMLFMNKILSISRSNPLHLFSFT
jgi:Asp-tRNA(Asn)/Glu-tRNA(Gln) amidotransferase A subunit family amidase